MARGKAFLVVGHKNWGKSRTLRALTDDRHQVRYVGIANHRLFIRRMSNDDEPILRRGDFREFVRDLRPAQAQCVILAFCPVFDRDARQILSLLAAHYDVHSFVLRHSFDGKRRIPPGEVAALSEFGPVEVYEEQSEAENRASALRRFIERHVESG